MIEAIIDAKDLDALAELLAKSPEVVQNARRQAMEQAASKLKQTLDAGIGGTGKVRGWQDQTVGSRGGYAAIHPRAKTYTQPSRSGTRYAVGYVTNAVNNGHLFPGAAKRQTWRETQAKQLFAQRIGSGRVPGKEFYQAAQEKAPEIAKQAAEQVVQALKAHLTGEGGTL